MDTKPWYLSKTIWGAAITALFTVLAILGKNVPADTQGFLAGRIMQAVDAIGQLVGVALAVYGRFTAKSVLT